MTLVAVGRVHPRSPQKTVQTTAFTTPTQFDVESSWNVMTHRDEREGKW